MKAAGDKKYFLSTTHLKTNVCQFLNLKYHQKFFISSLTPIVSNFIINVLHQQHKFRPIKDS